ncbi:MAG TPA: ATPase domain-containing protein, partial [Planctomycetota bacterium]|nr:ATPase domain-containing protein [Planctomycetota bacterium]
LVVIDPLTTFEDSGSDHEVATMLIRLVDYLKSQGITGFFTSLTSGGTDAERTDLQVASLIDTWLLLRDIELGGERNRGIYVLKSRGMPHSNQIREFLLTAQGARIVDVYVGPDGVLTGSMRRSQEAREQAATLTRRQERAARRRELLRRRRALEVQLASLRAEFEAVSEETELITHEEDEREQRLTEERADMARQRGSLDENGTP